MAGDFSSCFVRAMPLASQDADTNEDIFTNHLVNQQEVAELINCSRGVTLKVKSFNSV